MTMDHMRGPVDFICDGEDCEHKFLSLRFRIQDAVEAMKAAGWKAVRVAEGWKHYCGQCVVRREMARARQA